jgi:hypothetical protein
MKNFLFPLAVVLPLLSPAVVHADDVTATNCEAFVDKIQVSTSSHALTTMRLFLKIAPERLDAPVADVSVYHRRAEDWANRSSSQNEYDWRYDRLSPFFGATDYYSYETVIGHDWMSAEEEAVFVVTTARGTRYWVNAGNRSGGNFMLTRQTLAFLFRDSAGDRRPGVNVDGYDLAYVSPTADYPDDLAAIFNPRRCR